MVEGMGTRNDLPRLLTLTTRPIAEHAVEPRLLGIAALEEPRSRMVVPGRQVQQGWEA